jgi:hypothetical protein
MAANKNTNLIGCRKAAELAGVHENTIRNWANHGLVAYIRLPSGVRRYSHRDIMALMAKTVHPAAPQTDPHKAYLDAVNTFVTPGQDE